MMAVNKKYREVIECYAESIVSTKNTKVIHLHRLVVNIDDDFFLKFCGLPANVNLTERNSQLFVYIRV